MHFQRPGRCNSLVTALMAAAVLGHWPLVATAQQQLQSVVRNISRANERIEMTVNTSQILTLGTRIPRLVVNNPEIVTATPISETQIQIAARKPGVTQINLWDENGNIYTVDLLIFGDVKELELVLKTMFPASTLKVVRLTNSLVLNGHVDRPEIVTTIRTLAEDYAPKVVDNLTVGGVQQVILKVKVMEVSRTKLRRLGHDFAVFGDNAFFVSSVSDLIQSASAGGAVTATGETIDWGVVNDSTSFFSFIDFLQQNQVSKTLADPTLVTVSGRPASFLVGGQLPILVPAGLGQVGIEYKDFGTEVDFVPIVLGNGRIRLEIRPELSEIDDSRSVTVQGISVPALKTRRVDTGVEMNAGQTLAIAGLIQERIESSHRGMPYVSDLPVIGIPFRRVQEQVNEIESLVLVTPDFADAMDPHEVPPCGPGMETMSPSNSDLYCRGLIEVPACGPCGATDPCNCNAPGLRCQPGAGGPYGMDPNAPTAMATDGYAAPMPMYMQGGYGHAAPMGPSEALEPTPAEPAPAGVEPMGPQLEPVLPGGSLPDPAANRLQAPWQRSAATRAGVPMRPNQTAGRPATSTPGLIGPIGYDVQK
jgi:pilus assembly protein CpaC